MWQVPCGEGALIAERSRHQCSIERHARHILGRLGERSTRRIPERVIRQDTRVWAHIWKSVRPVLGACQQLIVQIAGQCVLERPIISCTTNLNWKNNFNLKKLNLIYENWGK